MTPQERAAARRAETARVEKRNHDAGLHRGTHVPTCASCIEERQR
jgi:hypothetical protein